MLVTLKEIIDMAEKGNYCIPAFNVYNTETVMGVIKAAEEERAPIPSDSEKARIESPDVSSIRKDRHSPAQRSIHSP